ncbi:hypothetical protein COMA2_320006 [Candidatus Nitrospira nitrificans]|uniref:Uncharacterized protein n=1 Tax=Candidatus Nitrospira nitrificans TaxID=1742973 RepID=A0A0S4LJD5_9BACT|nr:hypothetical protein COMA2_320006 [Candidatus Nitrospira nitrificans]
MFRTNVVALKKALGEADEIGAATFRLERVHAHQ